MGEVEWAGREEARGGEERRTRKRSEKEKRRSIEGKKAERSKECKGCRRRKEKMMSMFEVSPAEKQMSGLCNGYGVGDGGWSGIGCALVLLALPRVCLAAVWVSVVCALGVCAQLLVSMCRILEGLPRSRYGFKMLLAVGLALFLALYSLKPGMALLGLGLPRPAPYALLQAL